MCYTLVNHARQQCSLFGLIVTVPERRRALAERQRPRGTGWEMVIDLQECVIIIIVIYISYLIGY